MTTLRKRKRRNRIRDHRLTRGRRLGCVATHLAFGHGFNEVSANHYSTGYVHTEVALSNQLTEDQHARHLVGGRQQFGDRLLDADVHIDGCTHKDTPHFAVGTNDHRVGDGLHAEAAGKVRVRVQTHLHLQVPA